MKKRWTIKLTDTVAFNLDGKLVEIKVNLYPKSFSNQVFIDGLLVVEELLPDMKAQVHQGQSQLRKDKSKNIQLFVLWLIMMLMFLVYFQWN